MRFFKPLHRPRSKPRGCLSNNSEPTMTRLFRNGGWKWNARATRPRKRSAVIGQSSPYVFLLKMCSQIDKLLHFQEIGRIEAHITFATERSNSRSSQASAFAQEHVIEIGMDSDGQFPALPSTLFLFADSDLLSPL